MRRPVVGFVLQLAGLFRARRFLRQISLDVGEIPFDGIYVDPSPWALLQEAQDSKCVFDVWTLADAQQLINLAGLVHDGLKADAAYPIAPKKGRVGLCKRAKQAYDTAQVHPSAPLNDRRHTHAVSTVRLRSVGGRAGNKSQHHSSSS